jgi:uncharacterized protein YndB with AHSA1/START domain
MNAEHATFVIERRFPASVERVFRAWSSPEKKQKWFGCHDEWRTTHFALDFRVDGIETNTVERPDGVKHVFHARFLDIVPNERIVYAYAMHVGGRRISASLVTVTFEHDGEKATKMTFTEQVVFLDGHADVAERREGTEAGLANLTTVLSAG